MTYEAQRLEICQVGKLLYDRGYVVSNDGNLSLRVAPDRLLVTPSGVGKGRMTGNESRRARYGRLVQRTRHHIRRIEIPYAKRTP